MSNLKGKGGVGVEVKKIINNNMVRSINEFSQEVILLGKGLGFQKKVGDVIAKESIEKIYLLQDKKYELELIELLANMDFEYIQIVNKIIDYAELSLGKELLGSVYLSLTDHINFAVERFHENQMFKNNLHYEIKNFYPHEYAIGLKAIDFIKESLNVELPVDEASFIAMHILNAQLDQDYFKNTSLMTKIMKDVLRISEMKLDVHFDTESINYERFITHLKFFAVRLLKGEKPKDVNALVSDVIKTQYKVAYSCSLDIQAFIREQYEKNVNESELIYLTIHLNNFLERIV